jgi:bifunctional pyridoxal-dependent enzyme with beta-cystathionase and maltose regulon repressor activities
MLTWHAPEASYLTWLRCAVFGPGDQAREWFLDHGHAALEPGLRFGAANSGYARLPRMTHRRSGGFIPDR